MILQLNGEIVFRCDACRKDRSYLSDSWSEITIFDAKGREVDVLHHCLECRSDKREVHVDGLRPNGLGAGDVLQPR